MIIMHINSISVNPERERKPECFIQGNYRPGLLQCNQNKVKSQAPVSRGLRRHPGANQGLTESKNYLAAL
jgi:hypothetical protein